MAIAIALHSDAIVPGRAQLDRQIAAEFAPIFYQGIGEEPRADYITNFDFDGDWKGDNNWKNLDDTSLSLRAWVYYSVVETTTHYFVHYAVFHPRDYKGGLAASQALSAVIQIGIEKLGRDPTGGLADDLALSHENDFEGCLVVAAKRENEPSKAVVEYVETMAHNQYLRYRTASSRNGTGEMVELEGNHPLLFIEPRGHGIMKYPGPARLRESGTSSQVALTIPKRWSDLKMSGMTLSRFLILSGNARSMEKGTRSRLSRTSLHLRSGQNRRLVDQSKSRKIPARKLGSSLKGSVGFANKARMPWGWYDVAEKERPAGEWFFDPASVIARHFGLEDSFSRVYVYHPYLK